MDMFRAVAEALPGVPLLANMTEFRRTPALTADEFQALGYAMVIWPVSSLRVAAKAQATLYETIRRDGTPPRCWGDADAGRTYDTIGLAGYEAPDRSIIKTVLPDEAR